MSNLPITRGDTFVAEITIIEEDEVTHIETPVDLSTWTTITSQWREYEDSPTAHTLTVDRSQDSIGVLVLKLGSDVTPLLTPRGVLDVQVSNPGSPPEIFTIAKFTTVMEKDVTRA